MDLRPFEVLKQRYVLSCYIGGAMVVSVLVFGAIALALRSSHGAVGSTASWVDFLRVAFLGLSFLQLIIIPFIVEGAHRTKARKQSVAVFQDEQAWPICVRRLFKASIITYALCEIPALFALILYIISGKMADFLLLAAVALICFFFYFPRYEQWEHELRKMG